MADGSRIEVLAVGDSGRRRRWSLAEKRRIVEESFRPGHGPEVTARRHGLSRSQLYLWRQRYGAGLLGGDREPAFAPVVVASEPTATVRVAPVSETRIEIVLGNGRRVVVPVSVDPAALGRLLPVVEGA
ncbi:MAG: transposase [Rubrimonas sp.]